MLAKPVSEYISSLY
ncbi:hypothetical protein [Yersinia enterocolitica]|nr:hypothetical protein [Yersinia enterocolitica]